MAAQIPGYYFDELKKKYFKVEASSTAPAGAAWSEASVKRRKLETDAEAERKQALLRPHLIRRANVLTDPLVGGVYRREFGDVDTRDFTSAALVRGLREKDSFDVTDPLPQRQPWDPEPSHTVGCLYVHGPGGVVYTTQSGFGSHVRKKYIRQRANNSTVQLYDVIDLPDISSITYHQATHSIILTSRDRDMPNNRSFFQPPAFSRPVVGLPSSFTHGYTDSLFLTLPSFALFSGIHSCTPAPASSNLFCVMATDTGVVKVHQGADPHRTLWQDGVASGPSSRHQKHPMAHTVTSVDFQTGHHHVLVAGGRAPHVWLADLRQPYGGWTRIGTGGPTAHVRSVGEHLVLAAGPRDTMALYDIRFAAMFAGGGGGRSNSSGGNSNSNSNKNKTKNKNKNRDRDRDSDKIDATATATAPLLRFPEYRNAAHLMEIGLAVEPDLGLVAAAHDDGRVALYSLHTGRRLTAPDVDRIGTSAGGDGIGGAELGVVKALTFATMPGDDTPSLFAGVGRDVRKFTFGVRTRAGGEQGEEFLEE